MKNLIFISIVIIVLIAKNVKADLLECDESILSTLSGIGPKLESAEENTGDRVGELLKSWGCNIKKSATKFGENVKEGAAKLSENVKNGAKRLKEKVKDFGTTIKTKFNDLKEHLSKDSDESLEVKHKLYEEQVEMIDPDLVKSDQLCGHGHILDVLGNCSKLRK